MCYHKLMSQPINPITPSRGELLEAQIALFIAIGLQAVVWALNNHVFSEIQYVTILVELALALALGFTSGFKKTRGRIIQHATATLLIAFVTVANVASFAAVIYALLQGNITHGTELLGTAVAIFLTNIIVFALWYWEIDSPALTNHRWTKHDKDFQFTQQNLPQDYPDWRPEFVDYLYISVINSVNGASLSANPVTKHAKLLLSVQALISLFTLALVIARSVGILGA